MNSLYDESPFLEHHGIKGQKWGVKNGPPYPLDPESVEEYKQRYKNTNTRLDELSKATLAKGKTWAERNMPHIDAMNKAMAQMQADLFPTLAKLNAKQTEWMKGMFPTLYKIGKETGSIQTVNIKN